MLELGGGGERREKSATSRIQLRGSNYGYYVYRAIIIVDIVIEML